MALPLLALLVPSVISGGLGLAGLFQKKSESDKYAEIQAEMMRQEAERRKAQAEANRKLALMIAGGLFLLALIYIILKD